MNRERAETFLRLLAEAVLREAAAAAPVSRGAWSADSPNAGFARLARVAQALMAVHSLDLATARDILDDFAIAIGARQHSDPGPLLLTQPGMIRGSRYAQAWPGPAGRGQAARGGSGGAGPADSGAAGQGGPDRFVPLGLTAPFRHEDIRGELNLLSYARTSSGARFTITWRARGPADLGRFGHAPQDPVFPRLFTVKDDRGTRYHLEFRFTGGLDEAGGAGEIRVRPDPPDAARWLEFSAPGEAAVRASLDPPGAPEPPDAADGGEPRVGQTGLSAGEQLLNRVADRLLSFAAEYPQDLRLRLAATARSPLSAAAADLGDVVAALEAAEVLPPVSEVPGQLAALCASLRVSGHGLAVPVVAANLPERWLSVLAHYQRRKTDAAPARDGHAAVAAAFGDLDGVRLALLGLHNTDGQTIAHLLVSGPDEDDTPGPPDPENLPLSVWIRDSGGRWHVAGVAGAHHADGEYLLRLKLVPPLARSTAWIEVVAAWRSAEVRATLPLRWGYPP